MAKTILRLRTLHPAIQKSVITALSPSDSSAVNNMSEAQVTNLSNLIGTVGPQLATANTPAAQAALVQGGASDPMMGIALRAAAMLIATGEGAKWDTSDSVNPISGPRRRADRPVKLLPANVVLTAAGGGTLTFSPQEGFEGFRFCLPQYQPGLVPTGATGTGTYVSNLTAGDRLMFTENKSAPASMFVETSDLGRISFPLINLGETITATIAGGLASNEISGVVMGYGSRVRVLPPDAEILYERYEPISTTNVTGSGTATITLQPQRNIIVRRVGFDEQPTNFSVQSGAGALWVTSLTVQDMPQLVANTEFPAALFTRIAQDDWLDFDLCMLGGTITIGLRDSNSNAIVAQGLMAVDVVRTSNENRR